MKTVFIDIDGTLSSLCDINDKINMTEFPTGTFLTRLPVLPVIKAIVEAFPKGQYKHAILSACPHDQSIKEKNIWLDNYFPIEEKYFIKWKKENKADFIKNYCEVHNIDLQDIILIDDDHQILSECEALGVQVLHISRLLTLSQMALKK